MARKIESKDYENINDLCEKLKVNLLESLEHIEESAEKKKVYFLAEFEYQLTGPPKRVITPFFETLKALDEWCLERKHRISPSPSRGI